MATDPESARDEDPYQPPETLEHAPHTPTQDASGKFLLQFMLAASSSGFLIGIGWAGAMLVHLYREPSRFGFWLGLVAAIGLTAASFLWARACVRGLWHLANPEANTGPRTP